MPVPFFEDMMNTTLQALKSLGGEANIKEIVGKDGLYIEYFKAISLLEQLDEEDIFELIF